ncbi:MAG: insulinase family protein, partial [Candidatus Zixiibacteriota bacterium]
NSSSKVAGHLFYKTMFENKAFSRPIMGTSETINSITIENLKKHHHRFYAPQNIILSIVTDRPIEVIRKWVNSRFGRLAVEKLKYNVASPPEPIKKSASGF